MKAALMVIASMVTVFVLYLVTGAFTLAQGQEGLNGYEGKVWAQVSRANELLGRLEGQLEFGVDALKEINEGIVNARNDLMAAQQIGDLEAAMAATQEAQMAFNLVVEAYPDYFDLGPVFIGLQDETAGTFNRITYARNELIEAQVRFNQTRIFFFPLMVFFPHEDVLGAGFDSTTPLTPSTLGKKS